jgi:hypothetical protein
MDPFSWLTALGELPVKTQVVLGGSIFLVLSYLVVLFFSRPRCLNLPVVEASVLDYKSALMAGVLKV